MDNNIRYKTIFQFMVKHVKCDVNVIQQKYQAQDQKDNLVQSPTYLKMKDEYEPPTLELYSQK